LGGQKTVLGVLFGREQEKRVSYFLSGLGRWLGIAREVGGLGGAMIASSSEGREEEIRSLLQKEQAAARRRQSEVPPQDKEGEA